MSEHQNEKTVNNKKDHKLEFWLVIALLITLTVLLILLFVMPLTASDEAGKQKIIDFSKWVLPALLGAFGAWIGAGAAYFFGKESLKESSRSTQQALDTFKTNVEKFHIEDMHPMAIDRDFTFAPKDPVKKVLDGLIAHPEYWFVPILKDGKITDVIHLEAFWRYKGDHLDTMEKANVESVIDYIESELASKKKILHGFFVIAKMSEKITEVLERMKIESASVGIICDENGNPTHCFSRKDLRAFLLNVS